MGSTTDLFVARGTVLGLRVLYFTELFRGPSSLHHFCHLLRSQSLAIDPMHLSANEEREGEEDFKGSFREPVLREAHITSTHMPLTSPVRQGHLDVK